MTTIDKSQDRLEVQKTYADDLKANGFCVVDDVLSIEEVSEIREKLLAAARESDRRGVPTYIASLDQNDSNVFPSKGKTIEKECPI